MASVHKYRSPCRPLESCPCCQSEIVCKITLVLQSANKPLNYTSSFNMPPALPITGFGLLGMTWRPKQTPDEQAFAAMRAAVANGATVWSTASAYGYPPEPPIAGLLLIRRYFDKYPEDADKVTLFVRGCFDSAKFTATTKRAEVLESFEESQRVVGEVKKIDVFGPARMDANVPVEETVGALKELVDAGKISSAGLSEVSAATIRRASAVTPISMVEIEFSLWSTEMLTNGVAAACKEHNVAILAYAPLGYGFLVGQFTKVEDLPKGDVRLRLGRFQPDVSSISPHPCLLSEPNCPSLNYPRTIPLTRVCAAELLQEPGPGGEGQGIRSAQR